MVDLPLRAATLFDLSSFALDVEEIVGRHVEHGDARLAETPGSVIRILAELDLEAKDSR
jgi:hypothetical protein